MMEFRVNIETVELVDTVALMNPITRTTIRAIECKSPLTVDSVGVIDALFSRNIESINESDMIKVTMTCSDTEFIDEMKDIIRCYFYRHRNTLNECFTATFCDALLENIDNIPDSAIIEIARLVGVVESEQTKGSWLYHTGCTHKKCVREQTVEGDFLLLVTRSTTFDDNGDLIESYNHYACNSVEQFYSVLSKHSDEKFVYVSGGQFGEDLY